MLVAVIVTMCLSNGACIECTVTDQATDLQCGGAMALQVIPHWMEENGYLARGYTLKKWGCVIGGKRVAI